MATILHFRTLAKRPAQMEHSNSEQQPSLKSAQLLFFTGVRYERHDTEALTRPKPKRKRQPRQVEQTGS
jgi:G:T-mismatch repair DNA endonuclease (very short patch repair protein)